MAKRKEQETLHDQRSPKRTRLGLRSSFSFATSPSSCSPCSPCRLRLSPHVAISDSPLSATLSPKQHGRAEDLPASLPPSPDGRRLPDERRGSIERARSSRYRHQFGPLIITATLKREAKHHPLMMQHHRHHHGGVIKPAAKCGKPKLRLQPLNLSRDSDWCRDNSPDEYPVPARPYSPSAAAAAVAAAALGGCVQMWVCCGCDRDNGTDAVWCTNATCKHYTVNCLDCFSY